MNDVALFTVGDEIQGERLDAAVARQVPEVTRSLARQLIDQGLVTVNGGGAKPAYRVKPGDEIAVQVVLPRMAAEPEDIPLKVVYEDRDLAVIDKPAGLVVHPAAGHEGGTLANALAALYPDTRDVGRSERPGIVHRLDKDTSGLMVVALTPQAHHALQAQIAEREAERWYLALAAGEVRPEQGTIDAPIGRDPRDRKRMAVHGIAARPARTSYRVLEYLPGCTLVEARLHTGRTHQIRVHFAAMGHPLVGDTTYHGPHNPLLNRQFLHAFRLSFDSPTDGRRLEFTSALPPELEAVLAKLREEDGAGGLL